MNTTHIHPSPAACHMSARRGGRTMAFWQWHTATESRAKQERDKLRRKKGPLFEWSKPRTTIFYQILNSNSNIEYYPTSYTTEFHNRVVSEKKKTSFFIYSFSPLSVSTVLCCRYLFAYLYLISFIWPSTERHSEEREAEVKYILSLNHTTPESHCRRSAAVDCLGGEVSFRMETDVTNP